MPRQIAQIFTQFRIFRTKRTVRPQYSDNSRTPAPIWSAFSLSPVLPISIWSAFSLSPVSLLWNFQKIHTSCHDGKLVEFSDNSSWEEIFRIFKIFRIFCTITNILHYKKSIAISHNISYNIYIERRKTKKQKQKRGKAWQNRFY